MREGSIDNLPSVELILQTTDSFLCMWFTKLPCDLKTDGEQSSEMLKAEDSDGNG